MSESEKRTSSINIVQMATKLKSEELNMTKFMDLNDDCLLHLLRFFDVFGLMQLRGICSRLDNLILQSRKRFGIVNLKELNLHPFPFKEEKILEILEFLGPQIKELEFSSTFHYFIEDKSVIFDCITENFTILETFHLEINMLDIKLIEKFAPIVKRLKSLTLGGYEIDDQLSMCFLNASLEELKIEGCNEKITKKFFENVSNLKSLTIYECSNLTSSCYIEILKHNLKLKKLTLNVNSEGYPYNHLKNLEGSHNLVNFIVNNLQEIEELSFDIFSPNASLFADLPNLKVLNILQQSADYSSISRELNKLLEKLIEKNFIEKLSITTEFYSPINLNLVNKLTNLKELSLYGTPELDENDLIKLQTLENLEMLAIENLVKTTSVFCLLEPLKKLQKLKLEGSFVTPKFFRQLISLLRRLENRPKLNLVVDRIHASCSYDFLRTNKDILDLEILKDDGAWTASDISSDDYEDEFGEYIALNY
ncbi:uncharacterized protein LOC134834798 [Culicoides brevitarsis]|uniref:uncharacterized protein LOC134834798 n=1 Tax=Culicoides brevitarsis TaxID=469753 RepID=UPI00307C5B5B